MHSAIYGETADAYLDMLFLRHALELQNADDVVPIKCTYPPRKWFFVFREICFPIEENASRTRRGVIL
jgi:hypothetical protein